MYNEEFAKVYKDMGWELFPEIFGKYMIEYFKKKKIDIKTNLDLACGTGFLCNLFEENGIDSIGIDNSPAMLNLAKKHFPNAEFYEADIRNYIGKERVDLVTCTCDSLNHLNSLTNVQNALSTAHKNLKEDGYFAFDIIDTRKINLNEPISFITENAKIEYTFRLENRNKLITNILVTFNDGKKFEKQITEVVINRQDIEAILNDVGFKIIQRKKSIKGETSKLTLKLFYICKKVTKKKKQKEEKFYE